MDLSAYCCPNINYERKLQYVKSTAARIESRVVTVAAYLLTPIYTPSEKRQLISDYIKGTLVATFRSPPMKALERSVETLGLWIVSSAVTLIKSANQSSRLSEIYKDWILVINRVRGSYFKLQAEFFYTRIYSPSPGYNSVWNKTRFRNLQCSSRTRGYYDIFYISGLKLTL